MGREKKAVDSVCPTDFSIIVRKYEVVRLSQSVIGAYARVMSRRVDRRKVARRRFR